MSVLVQKEGRGHVGYVFPINNLEQEDNWEKGVVLILFPFAVSFWDNKEDKAVRKDNPVMKKCPTVVWGEGRKNL
jgi:hypothetical protein